MLNPTDHHTDDLFIEADAREECAEPHPNYFKYRNACFVREIKTGYLLGINAVTINGCAWVQYVGDRGMSEFGRHEFLIDLDECREM